MADRRRATAALAALQARYRLQVSDAQRLRELLGRSPVRPGPGVTVRDVLAGLTEAVGLAARLRRNAAQLGLDGILP